MRSEWQRKMIHMCSISIPIMYIWLTRETMLWIFVPLTVVAFVMEVLRTRVPAVEGFIRKYFGAMLRPHERAGGKAKISGATYVILSASLCALIFPKVVMIAGFAVLIVSDTASALFGRRFGRHRFLEKSVEGSSAFVVTAIMVVLGVAAIYGAPVSFILIGIVASFIAAVAEAMSYGVNIDDNLTIPLAFGAVMWGGMAVVGSPELRMLLEVR
jgi:dolichol kinase